MTIYGTFLSKGYFPKELPPAFFTESFSSYARTAAGRAAISTCKPANGYTDCVSYRLALPGSDGLTTRVLRIPHPFAYARLATIASKHFRRLLKKAGASSFSKSRPVYAVDQERALRTLIAPTKLARERALSRAGATHLVKADVSQFYPSLYTHAVGWAIDPKLRERKNWSNVKLLGKQVDQSLMDLQGKVSQGIPIGPDLSFLLAEIVLAQIDRALKPARGTAYRWFDDYEIACSSRRDAEETLVTLGKLLEQFKLRLNLSKTKIVELPLPAGETWQDELLSLSRHSLSTPAGMVSYFDRALTLRSEHPDSPVLLYTVGVLFQLTKPKPAIHKVAQSYMLQALLSEPGSAQKVFSLLSYWEVNGVSFDRSLAARTIETLAVLHQSRGLSSDLAWAIAFAIHHSLQLPRRVGVLSSEFDDDAVAIEALHASGLGLMPGLSVPQIERSLSGETCDGPHWLALYECVRQGFLPKLAPVVQADQLFGALLGAGVSFYRMKQPVYALLIHPGSAPAWVVRAWVKSLSSASATRPAAVGAAVAKLSTPSQQLSESDIVRLLLGLVSRRSPDGTVPYA